MVDLVDAHGRPRVVVTGMGVKTPAGVTSNRSGTRSAPGAAPAKTIERFDASELPVRFAGEVLEYDPALVLQPEGGAAGRPLHPARVRSGGRRAERRRRARRRPQPVRGDRRHRRGWPRDHGGERVDVPRARREPGQPVLRPDDDAQRRGRDDLDPLRLHRSRALHLHRVRRRRQRHRRGRPHGARRQRRGRRRRGDRSPGHAAHGVGVRPHGRDEHAQRRARPRVASVRRRSRRLRDRRGRRLHACSRRWSTRSRAAPRSTARCWATGATPTRTTSPRRCPAGRARPRACSSRSTTPGSTPARTSGT